MIMMKCVKIRRDKRNVILGYEITDGIHMTKYIKKEDLKNFIKSGKVEVSNLTLTKDGRLILKKSGISKKSLRDTIIKNNGSWVYNGLCYFMEDGKIAVEARDYDLRSANILQGTEVIADSAFSGGLRDLTLVKIPEGVTSIGENAFMYTGLKTVHIPKSVKHIGNGAFYGCFDLKKVTLPEHLKKFISIAFDARDIEWKFISVN